MSTHSDVVTYCWTELDRLATLTKFPGQFVTPYRVPPSALPGADDLDEGDYLELSLSKSIDPATVARFFREPYEWIPIPEEVDPGDTLGDMFAALFAFDPVRFAHMDMKAAAVGKVVDGVKNLLSSKPKFPGIDDVTPLADLASLHFEYWGNTDLRAAIFRGTVAEKSYDVLGVVSLTIPWFGSDPLSMPMALLEPILTPTSKDGAAIQFVLALRPMRGVTVAAPPSQKPTDLPVVVMSLAPPRIELDGWNRQILSPFELDEWKTGVNGIHFKITLSRPSVRTRIEILRKGEIYYSEVHEAGEYLLPISHSWSWNGWDANGVYDTTALYENKLSARVTVTDLDGRTTSATTSLGSGPDKIRWIDVTLDKKTKQVTATVHARFLKPTDVDSATFDLNLGSILGGVLPGFPGLPSLPSAPSLPQIPGLPSGNDLKESLTVPKTFDMDQATFDLFKKDYVINSIARHWTRSRSKQLPKLKDTNIPGDAPSHAGVAPEDLNQESRPPSSINLDGEPWDLVTSCDERTKDAFEMILSADMQDGLEEAGLPNPFKDMKQAPGKRSTNLACLMEGLPIIDIHSTTTTLDVGAHELGHSVLRETKGVWFSLTHKGTSTPLQERINDTTKGHSGFQTGLDDAMEILGSPPPQYQSSPSLAKLTGEVDVMLYLKQGSGEKTVEVLDRVIAVEEDALGLLWLGKVAFG